jgi:hypothetical protein
MNRTNKRRTGLGGLLALALGAVALLVMAGPAVAKDRNHDHIPDRWEKRHRLSLNVNQARRDQDGDHLRNLAEFRAGDNPRKADSDGDGIPDGVEAGVTVPVADPPGLVAGTDLTRFRPDRDPTTRTSPLRADTDGDGVPDGAEDRNRDGRRTRRETNPRSRDSDGDRVGDRRDRWPLDRRRS